MNTYCIPIYKYVHTHKKKEQLKKKVKTWTKHPGVQLLLLTQPASQNTPQAAAYQHQQKQACIDRVKQPEDITSERCNVCSFLLCTASGDWLVDSVWLVNLGCVNVRTGIFLSSNKVEEKTDYQKKRRKKKKYTRSRERLQNFRSDLAAVRKNI